MELVRRWRTAAVGAVLVAAAAGCGTAAVAPPAGLPSVSPAPAGSLLVGAVSGPLGSVLADAYQQALEAAGSPAVVRLDIGSPALVYRLLEAGRLDVAAEPARALLTGLDPAAKAQGSVGTELALSNVLDDSLQMLHGSAPVAGQGPVVPVVARSAATTSVTAALDRVSAALTTARLRTLQAAASRPGSSPAALARALLAAEPASSPA